MIKFDIIVVGAGIAGSSFAYKISKYAKVLLIDKRANFDSIKGTKIFPEHNRPFINKVDWNDKAIFPRVHNII
ncbi:MAG: FAD-dependent oxidoreductase [Promethearchaeota archaeon]|nr:MAG: FAD-dependent oxidoreductase [Candidatus Lokiarchaeota archaeon]